MKPSIRKVTDLYIKKTADNQLVDEDGYEVWSDYSGRHTYLKWSKRLSGSGVPKKYKPAWKSLKRLGDYISDNNKSFGLVFDKHGSQSAQIDFHDNDTADWKLVIRNVVVRKDGEDWGRWRIKKELPRGWYGKDIAEWNKKNEKLVKRALRGLTVNNFSYYDDTLTLRISRPNLRSPSSRTEVYVPSGTGNDREMVLHALEDQLGSYPTEFDVLRITPFEDDEDIVEVQYRMANDKGITMKESIKNIADRYMTAATKGFFIDRSTSPSTIYISDGRNVIYLETGGRYKGKFVPIESAKMPLQGLQSLPAGKEHFGLHIDGNIVSEIASVLKERSNPYRVVAPSLNKVKSITYSAPFDPKIEWDLLIGQPLSYGEPTGIPEIDRKHNL